MEIGSFSAILRVCRFAVYLIQLHLRHIVLRKNNSISVFWFFFRFASLFSTRCINKYTFVSTRLPNEKTTQFLWFGSFSAILCVCQIIVCWDDFFIPLIVTHFARVIFLSVGEGNIRLHPRWCIIPTNTALFI